MLETIRKKIDNLNLEKDIEGILADHYLEEGISAWYSMLSPEVCRQYPVEKMLDLLIRHMLIHDIMDKNFDYYRLESLLKNEEWSWFTRIASLRMKNE